MVFHPKQTALIYIHSYEHKYVYSPYPHTCEHKYTTLTHITHVHTYCHYPYTREHTLPLPTHAYEHIYSPYPHNLCEYRHTALTHIHSYEHKCTALTDIHMNTKVQLLPPHTHIYNPYQHTLIWTPMYIVLTQIYISINVHPLPTYEHMFYPSTHKNTGMQPLPTYIYMNTNVQPSHTHMNTAIQPIMWEWSVFLKCTLPYIMLSWKAMLSSEFSKNSMMITITFLEYKHFKCPIRSFLLFTNVLEKKNSKQLFINDDPKDCENVRSHQ